MIVPEAGDWVRVTFDAIYEYPDDLSGGHRLLIECPRGVIVQVPIPPTATVEVLRLAWATAVGTVIRFQGNTALTYIRFGEGGWRHHFDGADRTLATLRLKFGEPTVLYDASAQ